MACVMLCRIACQLHAQPSMSATGCAGCSGCTACSMCYHGQQKLMCLQAFFQQACTRTHQIVGIALFFLRSLSNNQMSARPSLQGVSKLVTPLCHELHSYLQNDSCPPYLPCAGVQMKDCANQKNCDDCRCLSHQQCTLDQFIPGSQWHHHGQGCPG